MPTNARIDRTETVARIVARYPETAVVFRGHRIDYCCRGDVTVMDAFSGRNEDLEALFAELESSIRTTTGGDAEDVRSLSDAALLARIVDRHHAYLRQALPRIEPLLSRVAEVHGAHNPKLVALRRAVSELSTVLLDHVDFEEELVFPGLVSLGGPRPSAVGHLQAMAREHLDVGMRLAQLRFLADDFTTPSWGCSSYRLLMSELEGLDADILQHVHVENHVLMPRFAGQPSRAS